MDKILKLDLEKLSTNLEDRLNNRLNFFQNISRINDEMSYKILKKMLVKEEKDIFTSVQKDDLKDSFKRLNKENFFIPIKISLNEIVTTTNKLKKEILATLGNNFEDLNQRQLQNITERSVKELKAAFTKAEQEIAKVL